MTNSNLIIGIIKLKPYEANFPKSNKLFPNGKGIIKSFLYIYLQKNNSIWGTNYWKFRDIDKKYNREEFTGIIDNNTINIVEDNPRPTLGSSGEFLLEKINNNEWKIKYFGIDKGITFQTTGIFIPKTKLLN